MPAKTHNILYSANSLLAYKVSKRFYSDHHYVWCATAFGSPSLDDPLVKNPRSSVPYERYTELSKDTGRVGDKHSAIVNSQKMGIKAGAQAKFDAREITKDERDEIIEIVDAAEISDFEPLMYVIPFDKVKKIAKRVPVAKRAHPLSDEWLIQKLPRKYFDVIKF